MNASDTYFASAQVSRQRARDEAMEVLQSVVENEGAVESVKNQALADLSKMAMAIEQEANIETLIMAKGFEKCVAVISGDTARIIVSGTGLTPAQIAQINEIVYEEANISPVNITITEKA
jgi:stage III sporulation protein AH